MQHVLTVVSKPSSKSWDELTAYEKVQRAALMIQTQWRANRARSEAAYRLTSAYSVATAARTSIRVNQVKNLLKARSKACNQDDVDSLMESDSNGDLVLHHACRNPQRQGRAAVEIIRFVIENSPASVATCNNSGQLPLHIACEKASDIEAVQILIDEYPRGVWMRDAKGDLPVHSATQNSSEIVHAVIELLLDLHPEAIQDEKDWLKLRKWEFDV